MTENNLLTREELLKAPFPVDDIQWRVITSGDKSGKVWAIVAPYVDSRAIMERLDDVVGAEFWQTHYIETAKGFLCELTIGDVTKSDGADCTDIEPTKGGISDALKRAGVPWGIGRYLYNLPTPMYADITPNGKYNAKLKDGKYHKWNPPKLPDWALPKGVKNTPNKPPQAPDSPKEGKDKGSTPLTGDEQFKADMRLEYARIGKEGFEAVLTLHDYTDVNNITEPDEQEKVLKAMKETTKEAK